MQKGISWIIIRVQTSLNDFDILLTYEYNHYRYCDNRVDKLECRLHHERYRYLGSLLALDFWLFLLG